MKKILKAISLCLLLAVFNYGQGKYENNQFLINALVEENPSVNSQPIFMSLPASDGFAPNISVQVQQYSGSLNDYAELSINQFDQMKLNVIKKNVNQTNIIFEYSGVMYDRNLHWYAAAYKKNNSVFLITATSLESQWNALSQKLISCVNSFKLK